MIYEYEVINCEYDFVNIIHHFHLTNVDLNLKIEVKNPNKIDVIMDNIKMNFYINDIHVAEGEPSFC